MAVDPLVALLEQVLEKQDVILAELRGRPANLPANPRTKANATLLQAIDSACGALPFTSGDLLAHANLENCTDLKGAILACVGSLSVKKLGKRLASIDGIDFGGRAVYRFSAGRDSIVWVLRVINPT